MKSIRLLLYVFAFLAVANLQAQGFRRFYPLNFSAPAGAVLVTPDGGFLFNSFNNDSLYLTKTSPEGEVIWRRSYLPPIADYNCKLVLLSSGHYAALIRTVSTTYSSLMTFDAVGNLLGQQAFLGSCTMSPVEDELYLIQPNWDTTYHILRLNDALDTLWEKTVKTASVLAQPNNSMLDMTTTSDGGFCLQSTFDSSLLFPKTIRLIKFDASANVLWERSFGMPNAINYGHILEAPNGDLIIEGVTGSVGSRIVRATSTGQQIWSKQVPHTVNALCVMTDASVACVGTKVVPLPYWTLTKLSPAGDILFTKSLYPYNYGSSIIGAGIAATPEGGLVTTAQAGTSAALAKTDGNGNLYEAFIRGRTIYDRNHDCLDSPLDAALPGWLVTATLDSLTESAITQADGFYEINLPVGDCVVKIHPPGSIWEPCDNGEYLLTTSANDTLLQDFLLQDSALCSLLEVSLGTPALRPCRISTYAVHWVNKGTQPAVGASVAVILPPALHFEVASIPVAAQNGDTLWFDLGDINYSQAGQFSVSVQVDCDGALVGQTLCVKAHIFPDTLCVRPPNWSGALVVADVRCIGDTLVEFSLKNIGDAPTQTLDYIITEDHVVLLNGNYDLTPGESMTVPRSANGSTQRIEAEQEPGYPFPSMPTAAVEGCGGLNATGQINRYALGDAAPFIDIDCMEVTSSLDPNDKQGFPTGYSDEHLIEPETELSYLLRFQNTGTDTAFYVEVRDTLSDWFDPATLRIGAASHDFTWSLRQGNALSFRFDNILLPDSNVNEAASHGFIQFRVQPKKDAPLGTLLENSASIYFDFNAPVRTNTTFHRLGHDFYVLTFVSSPDMPEWPVQVVPNPFRDQTRILLPPDAGGDYQFRLYSAEGRLLQTTAFSGNELPFSATGLTQGYYWFDILNTSAQVVARGKLLRQ
ncbi:MAG: DUF11 domain-containing protein [Saprospiraceae bacterium]|nr:DUF11 domain-containing protein [Saprospiraceae bacterium]